VGPRRPRDPRDQHPRLPHLNPVVQRWTLDRAGAVEGIHPAAQEACAHLRGMADPFAPIPDDMVCTQQYGGPQTASVTGRWAGRPVDLALSRVDGCTIAQWDGLGPLLPS
jgi:hypothetical protein